MPTSNPGPPPSRPSLPPYPRTAEGAHQRLDAHDHTLAAMGGILAELRSAFGTAPNAITGEAGSGVLLYLHRLTEERDKEQLLRVDEDTRRETWRRRWTALAGAVAFVATVVALLDRFGVFAPFKR